VRNEPDGSVVVHAVGPRAAIERLAEALLRGPPGGRVERREEIDPGGVLRADEFRIER
jgi:acylphosphatase